MTKKADPKTAAGEPSDAPATNPDVPAVPVDDRAAAEAASAALAPLRLRIDAIDREIVALLNERAEIALEIGRVKDASGGRAIRDPKRDAEVIERVTSTSAGLFPQPELVALYRRLIAATRQVQEEQRRRAKLAEGEPRG
jgi:chorismate mutase / prephenate dehydratase